MARHPRIVEVCRDIVNDFIHSLEVGHLEGSLSNSLGIWLFGFPFQTAHSSSCTEDANKVTLTGSVLHTLDTYRSNPPDPSIRLHRLARLSKPYNNCTVSHRHSCQRIKRCLLPCLRPVASRSPPSIPVVHFDYRGYLAPRCLRQHRSIPTLPTPANIFFQRAFKTIP